jgi:hypothetical protein
MMVNKHPLQRLAREAGGEYVLGMKDLHTHACYLIYGELGPGEQGRKVCPGEGHEEILLAVSGELQLSGDRINGSLAEGEAIHLREEDNCLLANPAATRARYILAGGHSAGGHDRDPLAHQ